MRTNLLSVILALIAAGCTRMPDEVILYEIGCREGQINLGYAGGSKSVEILSNGSYTASLPEGTDWIRFPQGLEATGEGDGTLTLNYDTNRSTPRRVELILRRGNNVARLPIRQEGLLDEGVSLSETAVIAAPEGGDIRVKLKTLLKPEDLLVSLTDGESRIPWIFDLRVEDGFLCFSVLPVGEDARHARIRIIDRDNIFEACLLVSQPTPLTQMQKLSVKELKAKLDAAGTWTADEHFLLEGQVINSGEAGNGAENRNLSADRPDLEWKYRIVYLQDKDGDSGLKVCFTERCDGVLSAGNRICIDLFGQTLTREEDLMNPFRSPKRFCLSNVPLDAILSAKDTIAPTPRIKGIGDLTADDLYTLVTIPGLELPFRKGPYVPVDLRDIALVTACPVPLCDGNGHQIPMLINADCSFSRDGEKLPGGCGSVTGVLVHEDCDNFEWDIELENEKKATGMLSEYISGCSHTKLGPWQIRPMKKSDIALERERDLHTGENGLSRLLYEWAWCDSLGTNLIKTYDRVQKVLYPSWPPSARPDTLDATFCCITSDGCRLDFNLSHDFTHLGPYLYGGSITQLENGNGIRDLYGRSACWNTSASANGIIYSPNGSAWQVGSWSIYQRWCAAFSTKGLDKSVSVCFGTTGAFKGNRSEISGTPRYWRAEWSSDGKVWMATTDYSVPDFPPINNRRVWQLPGVKYIHFTLPDEALDKDRIYVSLRPLDTRAGTKDGYENGSASGKNVDADHFNAINYFSIRVKQ